MDKLELKIKYNMIPDNSELKKSAETDFYNLCDHIQKIIKDADESELDHWELGTTYLLEEDEDGGTLSEVHGVNTKDKKIRVLTTYDLKEISPTDLDLETLVALNQDLLEHYIPNLEKDLNPKEK